MRIEHPSDQCRVVAEAAMVQRVSTGNAVRVAVLTERRAIDGPSLHGVTRALGRAGHEVSMLSVEDAPPWCNANGWARYDVVITRGRGIGLISAAYAAEAAGALVLNSPHALSAMHDRPTESRYGDLRVLGIGGQLHTLRPSAGPLSAAAVPTTPELARLAVRAAATYGLELFAVDVSVRGGAPAVTGVTDLPSYAGVLGADELVARYVIARCRAHRQPAREDIRVPA